MGGHAVMIASVDLIVWGSLQTGFHYFCKVIIILYYITCYIQFVKQTIDKRSVLLIRQTVDSLFTQRVISESQS